MDNKIKYNLNSSRRYGWKPDWFGADDHNEKLVEKIMEFQRSLGLSADGLCGPSTYRRIFTDRQASMTMSLKASILFIMASFSQSNGIKW